MSAKTILTIAAAAAIIAAAPAALADYTDYIPGVGIVKVSYISGSGSNMTLKVTTPNGKSYTVPGSVDPNGRGVPSSAALSQATNNQVPAIQPPSAKQSSSSVVDSSERREAQFKAENPEVSSNELLIGYPSGNLAVDSNTTAREVATVALRASGAAKGNEAWNQTEGMNDTDSLTVEEANEIMADTGYIVVDLNGDGIIQRGELFSSVPAIPAGAEPEAVPSVPTAPSEPSDVPGLGGSPSPSPSPSAGAPTCLFETNKGNILVNQRATLSWRCFNANSCSIDQGIGSVGTSGERVVAPTKSTTYIINCQGSGGRTVSSSATVNVYEVFIEEVPSADQ
jgi:hypothetical protein